MTARSSGDVEIARHLGEISATLKLMRETYEREFAHIREQIGHMESEFRERLGAGEQATQRGLNALAERVERLEESERQFIAHSARTGVLTGAISGALASVAIAIANHLIRS